MKIQQTHLKIAISLFAISLLTGCNDLIQDGQNPQGAARITHAEDGAPMIKLPEGSVGCNARVSAFKNYPDSEVFYNASVEFYGGETGAEVNPVAEKNAKKTYAKISTEEAGSNELYIAIEKGVAAGHPLEKDPETSNAAESQLSEAVDSIINGSAIGGRAASFVTTKKGEDGKEVPSHTHFTGKSTIEPYGSIIKLEEQGNGTHVFYAANNVSDGKWLLEGYEKDNKQSSWPYLGITALQRVMLLTKIGGQDVTPLSAYASASDGYPALISYMPPDTTNDSYNMRSIKKMNISERNTVEWIELAQAIDATNTPEDIMPSGDSHELVIGFRVLKPGTEVKPEATPSAIIQFRVKDDGSFQIHPEHWYYQEGAHAGDPIISSGSGKLTAYMYITRSFAVSEEDGKSKKTCSMITQTTDFGRVELSNPAPKS